MERTIENKVGETLTTAVVEVVVNEEEYWKQFQDVCCKIMKRLNREHNETNPK